MPGAFVSAVGPHLTIVVPQQHRTFRPCPRPIRTTAMGQPGPRSRDSKRAWFRQCPGASRWTAIGSGSTPVGSTSGPTGKRVYIGLSERAWLPLSTGPQARGKARGAWGGGWNFGAPAQRRRQGLWPCSVMQFGSPDSAEAATGISQNGVSRVPAMGPSLRPAPCSPIQSF